MRLFFHGDPVPRWKRSPLITCPFFCLHLSPPPKGLWLVFHLCVSVVSLYGEFSPGDLVIVRPPGTLTFTEELCFCFLWTWLSVFYSQFSSFSISAIWLLGSPLIFKFLLTFVSSCLLLRLVQFGWNVGLSHILLGHHQLLASWYTWIVFKKQWIPNIFIHWKECNLGKNYWEWSSRCGSKKAEKVVKVGLFA